MNVKTRRVVITGIGLITPLGLNVKDTWRRILNGKSGIRLIQTFDTSEFAVKFAGTIPNFNPESQGLSTKDVKKMDISIQMGLAAAIQAWKDSEIDINKTNTSRIGVSIGSGIGGLTSIVSNYESMKKKGVRKISPFFIPSSIINMISGQVSLRYGLKGPNIAIVSACATGTHNIGYSARTISFGDADIMITGGSEKASCELGIGGFLAARALSKRNNAPEKASRPWDKDRDGFVLGDGSGILVLEEYEHAKKRNAKIYAEIIGFGISSDAYHMTLPNGIGAYHSMKNAIKDASITVDKINYINAHATSTIAGDVVESQVIERIMGDYARKVMVSSTKSMIGHSLGASGAIEAIFSILSLYDQVVPPTINLDNIDLNCNLDYVPYEARNAKLNVTLSNSFGFGGTNGTVIFKRI